MDQIAATSAAATTAVAPYRPPTPPNDMPGIFRPLPLGHPKTVFDSTTFDRNDPSFDNDGAAARVVAAYDHDNNGVIDLNGSSQPGVSEVTRRTVGGVKSIAELARAADQAGDKDGKVTVEEVASFIDSFERREHLYSKVGLGGVATTVDGVLEGRERSAFLKKYGEDYIMRDRLPGVIVMPERPKPGLNQIPLTQIVGAPRDEGVTVPERDSRPGLREAL